MITVTICGTTVRVVSVGEPTKQAWKKAIAEHGLLDAQFWIADYSTDGQLHEWTFTLVSTPAKVGR